jgi:hypothetical protein
MIPMGLTRPARAYERGMSVPPLPSGRRPEAAWDDVAPAHLSLLQGDFMGMARAIKAALMRHPDDAAIREDLLDLMDQAFAFGAGRVPADWKLPEEITSFQVGLKRRSGEDPARASHYLFVEYDTPRPDLVERVQVIRYPDEVLIDAKGGHGARVGRATGLGRSGLRGYVLGSEGREEPLPDGLYLLNIKIGDKPAVEGWFTLHAAASSAPEIESPARNQVFRTPAPTFRWQAYRSPEFRPFEERKLLLRLFEGRGGWYEAAWNDYAPTPEQGSFTLGEGTSPKLAPGSYSIQLMFEERRRFGDLVIARESARHLGFEIASD